MPAVCGALTVVSIDNSGGTLTAIGGLRSRVGTFNLEVVDTTFASLVNGWRVVGPAAMGVASFTVQCDGVFDDDAGAEAVRDAFFLRARRTAAFLVEGYQTMSCEVRVSRLSYRAAHNGALEYSFTLESAGAMTFAVDS